jgi:nucleoside diphosphate kinase
MNADGKVRCLALIYAGKDAVNKIRSILGPTDPSKAQPGSVRKEYGSDIMVNAAHASDSAENAQREIGIIKPERNLLKQWFDKYYA